MVVRDHPERTTISARATRAAQTLKKMMKMKSIRMRTGNSRYAPMTPEMAPDAPTVGTGEAESIAMCARANDSAQQVEGQERPAPCCLDAVPEDPE